MNKDLLADAAPPAAACGKVYLVGAGPSDAGLLTLKALAVLKEAQAVIYDALIGPDVLCMIPPKAQKIAAGKRAGRHSMKQDEINRLLVEKALEGKQTVRLKGGDPFLFGRGYEEIEALRRCRIPYEVVPGVPSVTAAAAYAGIPLTHRGMSASVHLLAGHRKQNEPLDIDFLALARSGGTCAFFMGMSVLPEIVQGCLNAGMAPDMPAAVIEQGTSARQRVIISTLEQLEAQAARQKAGTPAIILIGKTAALGMQPAWWEQLPLCGSCILVTRPAARSGALARRLRMLGAQVLEVPAIRTQLREQECRKELLEALAAIGEYQYLVFTSPAGVDYFFELLLKWNKDIRCIGSIRLAVIGSATGDALKKRGLMPELMPEQYNGEALGKLLNSSLKDGEKVLILRSAKGSPQLVTEIQRDRKVQVKDIAIYDTVPSVLPDAQAVAGEEKNSSRQEGRMEPVPDIRALAQNGCFDMVMLTSASSADGFVQMTRGLDYSGIHAVCIGRMTAQRAAFYGMQVHVCEQETIESMADAAVQLQRSGKICRKPDGF